MSKIQIRAFSKIIDGTTTRSVIALAAGQPVGSIDVSDWQKPGGWVMSVNVAEDFRRQGIARRMFERVVSDAREAGKSGLGLSVKEENKGAQALYNSLGFRVCYAFDNGTVAMTLHL